jgi:hypothetical protein
MFVEAYVNITTGQVKTVWHDNYPTCWDSENDDKLHRCKGRLNDRKHLSSFEVWTGRHTSCHQAPKIYL